MSHWSWLFVEKSTHRCTICDKVIKSCGPTNNTTHLTAKHNLNENSEETKVKAQEQAETMPRMCSARDATQDSWCNAARRTAFN